MIYFAVGEWDSPIPQGCVKIGASENIARRMSTLKAFALVLLEGNENKEERAWQRRFKHLQVRPGSEYFWCREELLAFIEGAIAARFAAYGQGLRCFDSMSHADEARGLLLTASHLCDELVAA